MLPTAYNRPQRQRRQIHRVAVPGKGDFYIVRESSPLSLSSDEQAMGGFFKSVSKAFSSVTKAVSKVATSVTKVALAPLRAGTALYAKTGGPGSSVLTKLSTKALNLVEQIPASQIGYMAAMTRAPFVLAKGVTSGNIMGSFKQVETEVRVGGGKPLAALVKVGKIVVPAVLTYIMPPLGLAISAAIIARDIYVAKKDSAKAKANMESKIHDAYQTYVDGVKKGGYNPVDEATFRAWLLAGGTGNMPLGAAIASAGGADGGYEVPTSPTVPEEAGSILPLILVAGAAALSAPAISVPPTQPTPPQSSSIIPWITVGVMLYKK